MFKVVHLKALILASCFCCPEAQHPAWLYPMPWRPLILPRVAPTPLAGVSQLSPGYTGPQTFPPVPQDQQQGQQQQQYQQQQQQQHQQQQQYPPQYPQQPVLFGLFAPQLQVHPLAAPPQAGHFTLPFRPSPFAGYTDDEVDNEVQEESPDHQPHQQQLEPPFHAHPYKVAERSEIRNRGVHPEGSGSGNEGSTPLGYVYLSPSNIYNLVRS
ncbi:ATP-dependent RNA helicase DHH1 [Drosophila ananassae]|uniref:ATP-dependent RNA helicase DHH1 n=1 Tax=Drosophila ananassae TaxID=7217 RepID=UPI0013A5DC80|nr:ATP-dependent RNA helicase DHH1 [Drosophila ananassae]